MYFQRLKIDFFNIFQVKLIRAKDLFLFFDKLQFHFIDDDLIFNYLNLEIDS